jgi:hypothetical protein
MLTASGVGWYYGGSGFLCVRMCILSTARDFGAAVYSVIA